jgi:RNA polymerase sigma-70 factor, ECF subfamily
VQNDESVWLKRALNGDSQAFSQLVEHYQRPVYNLCYRMLGNAQDAEDAAQEAFLRAYKSMRQYDFKRSFSTWLLSIAAHYCIDQIRRRRMVTISVEELVVPDLPVDEPDMDSRLSRKEDQKNIRALLQVLESVDRAVVIMYYWYDFSYEEISQTLKLSESAVKSRLHRARRAMASQWVQENTMPGQMAERVTV